MDIEHQLDEQFRDASKKSQPHPSLRQAFMRGQDPGRLGAHDDRSDRSERPGAALTGGRQHDGRVRAQLGSQDHACESRIEARPKRIVECVARRVQERKRAQDVPQLACRDERVGVDAFLRLEEPTALEPCPELRGRRELVVREVGGSPC